MVTTLGIFLNDLKPMFSYSCTVSHNVVGCHRMSLRIKVKKEFPVAAEYSPLLTQAEALAVNGLICKYGAIIHALRISIE